MREKKKRYLRAFLPLLLLLGIIGVTFALMRDTTSKLDNKFVVGEVTTVIEEDPKIGTEISKNPSVKSLGPNDCIIRMRINVSPKQVADYLTEHQSIDYDTTHWKYNEEDGFWYYQGVVPKGASTTPLFTTIGDLLTEDGKIKEDFTNLEGFEITLYQEAVQSEVFAEDGTSIQAWDADGYVQGNAMKIWGQYDEKNL